MITLDQLQSLLSDQFFNGNDMVAGLLIYTVAILCIFVLTKKSSIALIVALPITFVFNQLGFVAQDMMLLLIIVTVLGLAYTTSKDVFGRG